METEVGKKEDELPQLLDLISNEEDWFKGDVGRGEGNVLGDLEEEKLELSLAPPGGEGREKLEKLSSALSSAGFSKIANSLYKNTVVGAQQVFFDSAKPNAEAAGFQKDNSAPFPLPVTADFGKESSLEANMRMNQSHERRVHSAPEDGVLVKNRSQIRLTSSPVVGWPPVRSFRKNIAINSSKISDVLHNAGTLENRLRSETSNKGFFVKINVDGIPIGRKLNLNAYDNYEMLSSVVEELFCGLLSESFYFTVSCTGMGEDAKRAFTGLLDGSGEYTLVYEDNEGDRMLVGDVPWE
ncbi:Auxin-responsive protein IAA26 [Platanthera zijinensis]|uniref:Auxin-responsive protein n=1 Tax=Platanthera zijinensis TaxID=2320716 RepID=A0AAP0BGG5_9ASPA